MLCGDLYLYSVGSHQSGGSPHCRLCQAPYEDLPHVVATCRETDGPRQVGIAALKSVLVSDNDTNLLAKSLSEEDFRKLISDEDTFTQFALDPTSFNLPADYRISFQDVNVSQLFTITRTLCYSINRDRLKKLRNLIKT